jgi:hypothetical protein
MTVTEIDAVPEGKLERTTDETRRVRLASMLTSKVNATAAVMTPYKGREAAASAETQTLSPTTLLF